MKRLTQTLVLAATAALLAAFPFHARPALGRPNAVVTVYPTARVTPSASPSASATATTASTPSPAAGGGLPELVRRFKPAVVKVSVYDGNNDLRGTGSGFFVSSTEVITNCHVINGADHAEIKTADGEVIAVQGVTASNRERDIARLRVSTPRRAYEVMRLRTEEPPAGEHVVVIGAPLGLEQSVSDGIVSAVRDFPGMGHVIQITAPVSPGNSGGPVIDNSGNVLGIVQFQSREGQNLNFAIPSDVVAHLTDKPLATLAAWNRDRPAATSSKDMAAVACQLYWQALSGGQYHSAWNLMTRNTQESLVRTFARLSKSREEDVQRLMDGDASDQAFEGFWSSFASGARAQEKAVATYRVMTEEEDKAVVEMTGTGSPTQFLMFKENGIWKVGIAETAAAKLNSH